MSEILRLNKYIAQSGICSRNQAAEWVKAGFVTLNGKVVKEPFLEVGENDIITVKNKRITPKKNYTYLVINKPYQTPVDGKENDLKSDVNALIKKNTDKPLTALGNPNSITCGLVVMTDDSELLSKLSQYGHQLKMVFEVTIDHPWKVENNTDEKYYLFKNDIRINCESIEDTETQHKVGLEMLGGMYSDVFDFFKENGMIVQKLDCTFLAGITKKDLKRGWSRMLAEKEIVFMKHFS